MNTFEKIIVAGAIVYAVRLYGNMKEVEGFAKGCEVTIKAYKEAEKENEDNK